MTRAKTSEQNAPKIVGCAKDTRARIRPKRTTAAVDSSGWIRNLPASCPSTRWWVTASSAAKGRSTATVAMKTPTMKRKSAALRMKARPSM